MVAPERPAAKRPGAALAAAILWTLVGGLSLLYGVVTLIAGGTPSAIIALGVGAGFLVAGLQTALGRARDTLGSALASILLGGLLIAWILIAHSTLGGAGTILLGGYGVAVALIVAGTLALVGREGYQAWRAGRVGM